MEINMKENKRVNIKNEKKVVWNVEGSLCRKCHKEG